MTIRNRITAYIVGAGFIAGLLYSAVVFYELIEQPFDLMDSVLKEEAYRTVDIILESQGDSAQPPQIVTSSSRYLYWIEVYDQDTGALLYQSDLAKLVSLSRIDSGDRSIDSVPFASDKVNIGQKADGTVSFRIRSFLVKSGGKTCFVQIARPMEHLEKEIQDLVLGILAGFVFSILILILISRFVAGRILKPVGAMQNLARDIGERNLDRRIPTGEQRDELSELARTINKMLDRLQYSFARQREFLFATSHELKTPLTTLRLAADEITRCDAEALSQSARDNLPRLQEQVLRMERLVKDLLNLSSLETMTRIDPAPVDLNEILLPLADEYRFLADARGIGMDIQIPRWLGVSGDVEKLRRAFSNILDNAVKYNVDGGRIELAGDTVAGEVRVTVANTGPGVAESEIPRVFDQFFRGEKSRSSQHGGSGLGLAIVKRIVELHGGRVTFESREGGWSLVSVFLPERRETVME